MTQQTFAALCDDLTALAGRPLPPPRLNSLAGAIETTLELEGRQVVIQCLAAEGEALLVRCAVDYGPDPESGAAALAHLRNNFRLFAAAQAARFCLHPHSDRMVRLSTFRLVDVVATELMSQLKNQVREANHWCSAAPPTGNWPADLPFA